MAGTHEPQPPGLPPVGYLLYRREGLKGTPGIGYDYITAANGVHIQSQGESLTARIPVAHRTVKGLAPVDRKVELRNGRIPAHLFELGLNWMLTTPTTEKYFALSWEDGAYRLLTPPQSGTGHSVSYETARGTIAAEFHSHGALSAFFSGQDDTDEQGLRIYGVTGRLDTGYPELCMRVGVYGHFDDVDWETVFDGPPPATLEILEAYQE